MGSVLSGFFQSGSRFLSSSSSCRVSDHTRRILRSVFETLQYNPHATPQSMDLLLAQIPKGDNILAVTNSKGFNILQVAVGNCNVELVRWIVSRGCDVNRCICSFPLHIACYNGYYEIVEILLKHGARVDTEARMCWPGPHNHSCEQRVPGTNSEGVPDRSSDKLQSAIYYAIDGDYVDILDLLMQQIDANWLPWHQKQPLLHLACERGAWNCVKFLVVERSLEINQCYDEYYPIHQAALHDIKFLDLLLQCGADVKVRTATQQMTVLHVVFLLGKKSASETLQMVKLLIENGLRELINEADSLGNTPLHALIVRYALEEARFGCDPPPWNKWDMLLIMCYLIQNGASASINRPSNSALACVLRHVRDWEFRYELLDKLLFYGGNPNLVGRDGSVPLMVCLVPLINKNPLHYLTHTMKIFYLNCVRLLCKNGANPNCSSRSTLTPLHVLVFTASEYMTLSGEEKIQAFQFIQQLLVVLLQHGLDPNVRFSQRTSHTLLSLMDMVQNARSSLDLDHVYDLTSTLLLYGANPNLNICTSEPLICHSQSSVFLKKPSNQVLYFYVQLIINKEKLLMDQNKRFERIIWLYYFAMDHKELYHCLKILYTQTTLAPMRQALSSVIRHLYTHPRTLKQIARVTIYKSMGRKFAPYMNKLNLPGPLKEYLLCWDP
ncbi:hypothetical protein CHUAL_011547 [Chamberlinius hualienensis]